MINNMQCRKTLAEVWNQPTKPLSLQKASSLVCGHAAWSALLASRTAGTGLPWFSVTFGHKQDWKVSNLSSCLFVGWRGKSRNSEIVNQHWEWSWYEVSWSWREKLWLWNPGRPSTWARRQMWTPACCQRPPALPPPPGSRRASCCHSAPVLWHKRV